MTANERRYLAFWSTSMAMYVLAFVCAANNRSFMTAIAALGAGYYWRRFMESDP